MLLMNAMPPANYAGLQALEQQYQFTGVGYLSTTVSGMVTPAFVLHSTVSGTGVNGFYLIRSSDGAIFPYDGSGSYAHSFATGTALGTFGASLYSFPSELVDAQAAPSLYAQLYKVDQQLDLQEMGGSFMVNQFGNLAKWLYSPVLNQYGQHWYTLILSGGQSVIHAWEGYQDSSVGAVVATFATPAVYNNPMLLTTATFMPNPATASITSTGALNIGLANSGFVGSFKVMITVSDGVLSTSQTVTVTSTDTAPALTVTQNSATVTAGSTVSVPHGSFPLNDSTTVTSAGNQPLTTTASVSSYSQLFDLEERLRLQFVGNMTVGTAADVFSAAGTNKLGSSYYVLSPAGMLYAYDGGNNYATSFAGTPVATLGDSVYQDPTLLTNAQPPVNYAQLNALETQYQFQTVGPATGVTAEVLRSSQPGPGVMGYYLLTPNGSIYAYDGSSLATTLANSAKIIAAVDPGVFVNPSLLINATVSPGIYPLLQQTEQKLDLQELPDGFHTGLMGNAAKWLFSPVMNSHNQHYYTLALSTNGTQALLYAWDGGSKAVPTGATPVAVLDPSVYANPMLLLNAKAPEAAAGVTVNGGTTSVPVSGTFTLAAPTSFVGTFQVTVTTTDGALTTTQTFQVASTDTAPVAATIANQTASKSGSPLQLTLSSTDAENDSVSYTAQAVGYSAAYNLQQQYQFTAVGLFSTLMGGVTTPAFVLHSNVLGSVEGYYLINASNGGVYAYDGSGNYATTFANSANLIATLSPSVFTNPMLLTNAMAPSAPNAVVAVTGNMLSVNVAGVAPGTVFQVIVTANDGAETTQTSFLVTVTA
jgi:hypothetical protein